MNLAVALSMGESMDNLAPRAPRGGGNGCPSGALPGWLSAGLHGGREKRPPRLKFLPGRASRLKKDAENGAAFVGKAVFLCVVRLPKPFRRRQRGGERPQTTRKNTLRTKTPQV